MATIQQKQAVKDQVGTVPTKGSSMKVAIIGLIAVVAIALLLFFVNRGTGKAIVGLDEGEIAANTGGVFLSDNTLPLGTSDLGNFPVRVKFANRTVAFTFNYNFEGAVQDCTFTLDPALTAIGGVIVLNNVTQCDAQTGGKVEFAFLCSNAACSNALNGVKTIGLLHVTNTNGNNNPISVHFTDFNYVDFDSDADIIVPVTGNDATIRFVNNPVCEVGAVTNCSTEQNCLAVSGFWYQNECNAEPAAVCGADNLELCFTLPLCEQYGGYFYVVDGEVSRSCNADRPADSCTDSDGGNDLLVKGTVEALSYGNPPFRQSDRCVADWGVNEFQCVDNHESHAETACAEGMTCHDGACVDIVEPVDSDGDGILDENEVEGCINNNNINCGGNIVDTDGDTVPDAVDNCPAIANQNQADADTDDVGDVCVQDANCGHTGNVCPYGFNCKPVVAHSEHAICGVAPCTADVDCAEGYSCVNAQCADQNANPLGVDIPYINGSGIRIRNLPVEDGVYRTEINATRNIEVPFTVYTHLIGPNSSKVVFEARQIPSLLENHSFIVRTDAAGKDVRIKTVVVYDTYDIHQWVVHTNQTLITNFDEDGNVVEAGQ